MRMKMLRKVAAGVLAAGLVVQSGALVYAEQVTEAPAVQEDSALTLVLSGAVTGEGTEETNQMLSVSNIKLILETTADKFLANADVQVMGQSLVKLVAMADEEKIAVSFPDADPSVYVYRVADLLESLQKADGDNIFNLNINKGPDISPEEYVEVLTPYVTTITEFIGERIAVEANTIEFTHLGTTADGGIISWEPSGSELGELINAVADQIETDDQLEAIAGKWADYYEEMLPEAEEAAEESGLSEVSDAVEEMATPENVEALRNIKTQAPAAARELADELSEQYPDPILSVKIGMVGEDMDQLALITAGILTGEEEASTEVDGAAATAAAFPSFAFEAYDNSYFIGINDGESDYGLKGTYAADGGKYTGEYTVVFGGMELGHGSYDFGGAGVAVTGLPEGAINLNFMGLTAELGVKPGTAEGDDHYLTVNGLNMFSDSAPEGFEVHLKAKTGGVAEEPTGEEVDITDYTQEQLGELAEKIGNDLQAHMEKVFGE